MNVSGQLYNATTTAFESEVDANWTSTKYCLTMTRQGTSQVYLGSMPAAVATAGRYSYITFQQAGGSPALTDTIIAQGTIDYTGSVVASIATHTGTDGKTLLSANAQTGVTIPTVTTVGTLTTYTGNTPQTGDAYARLGAPVNASTAADIAAVAAKTSLIATNAADSPNQIASQGNVTTIQTRLGTPSGASIDADILSRLATSGYTVPPTTAQILTALNASSTIPAWYVAPSFPTNFTSLSIDASGRVTLTPAEHTLIAGDVLNATASSYNTGGSIGHGINSAGSAGDPWATLLANESTTGSFGALLKQFAFDGSGVKASVYGYGTGQDPATLVFNSTLLQSNTSWTTGSYGYYLERSIGADWGGYARVPSTGVITFTMPNGLTYTATISVNGSGQVTGRVTN